MIAIRRALISVSNKSGLVPFAEGLHARGISLVSTGGTAKLLAEHGVPVVEVSDYTGFPEIMGGRIKTLHPRVHGGLLGRRGTDDAVMQAHGIEPIDLLVVNLYPFERVTAEPDCDLALAIENIDIGGPAMVRAAAKNHHSVAVVVDPTDYEPLLAELDANDGNVSEDSLYLLAVKAFEHTARYDAAICNYLSALRVGGEHIVFPRVLTVQLEKRQDLRYGENPHQRAAFYASGMPEAGTIAAARQIQGKELSYNNIADADAALDCVSAFEEPACVIVKHANPCGAAIGHDSLEAYERAYATDPAAAFGGIIAFNRTLDATTTASILDRQFVEVIACPAIEDPAIEVLKAKPDVRLLVTGFWPQEVRVPKDYKSVAGGVLVQDRDVIRLPFDLDGLRIVTRRPPGDTEILDLFFAWKIVICVKSNAIVYARGGQTIGIGAGQMSRVTSVRIAVTKAEEAGLEIKDAVMASDAFFPFRDSIDAAAAVGVRAVIQPGGSIRDQEVIAAADEHDMAMVFTGVRHFRH